MTGFGDELRGAAELNLAGGDYKFFNRALMKISRMARDSRDSDPTPCGHSSPFPF